VLEQAAGLSDAVLRAVADLEREVVEADGGRLKLEWGQLRGRSGDRVEDLLWWEGERLAGFLGLYTFGAWVELAGMVAPSARGRGIGTALLDAAIELCRSHGDDRALLIVPRQSVAGRRLALRWGGVLDHSEHALVLLGEPVGGSRGLGVSLRAATRADVPLISNLLEDGFGFGPPDIEGWLDSPDARTLVVERNRSPIGTLRLHRDAGGAGIYGFVIDAAWRGRGFGREALRQACEELRGEGAERIGLEVDVANDHALGLYTSVGFEPVATEDYYSLTWSPPPR
jgi:ribosomal protein S18 acetylase RimI-like enzyme